jgi:RNA polymerase sigma factor (sigma-70 family)
MNLPSSVSTWIRCLQAGDKAAAGKLWQRYHAQLMELARQRLGHRLRAEAEDVVARAFVAFFRAVEVGRSPDISDRDDLWRLLLTITLNQARRAVRDASRQRRDVRRTVHASDLFDLPGADLDRLAGEAPDPALVTEIDDELQHLLRRLPEELHRAAVDLLAGWTPAEIALRLSCSVRTIERRRERIRQYWLADSGE